VLFLASPPAPLQGERGVKCLVGAWLLCLLVLVVALHITPLSPWRGVGGEAG